MNYIILIGLLALLLSGCTLDNNSRGKHILRLDVECNHETVGSAFSFRQPNNESKLFICYPTGNNEYNWSMIPLNYSKSLIITEKEFELFEPLFTEGRKQE